MNRQWMPLYIADYLKDTTHLRAAESGAYLHLIMAYWVSGKLPDDDRQLATIAKVSLREFKKMRASLAAFFGPGWTHKRIDAELAKAREIAEKAKERGRAGANARYSKHASSNAPSMPEAKTEHAPSPSPTPSKEEKKSGADAPQPRDIRSDLFGQGRQALERITGKTPDSCRALIGRWLKSVDDEAIQVLGAIEDAERNRIADPVAWITQSLKSRGGFRATQANAEPRGLSAVAREYAERAAELARGGSLRDGNGSPTIRVISGGKSERPGNLHGSGDAAVSGLSAGSRQPGCA